MADMARQESRQDGGDRQAMAGDAVTAASGATKTARVAGWLRNLMLTFVVVSPIALAAQNIIGWARDPDGLGLSGGWPYLVFGALDAAAGVCVMMTLILASDGRRAGLFGPLVWVFAGASAFAGYRHGREPGAPSDIVWFFPLMSFLGPLLLHLVLSYIRRLRQVEQGRRLEFATASAFRVGRWVPGVGAFVETYGSWRVARLEGIEAPADAIRRYRQLCPDGGWRVLRAMRREVAALQAATLADAVADAEAITAGVTDGDKSVAPLLAGPWRAAVPLAPLAGGANAVARDDGAAPGGARHLVAVPGTGVARDVNLNREIVTLAYARVAREMGDVVPRLADIMTEAAIVARGMGADEPSKRTVQRYLSAARAAYETEGESDG